MSALAPARPWPPRRVLVLRFGAVGDVLLTAPAVGALRRAWPEAEIVYATRAPFAGLAAGLPGVREVVALGADEGLLVYARRLAAAQPDALLDLHASPRSRALRWLLPARPTAAWHKRRWQDSVLVRLGLRRWHAEHWLADRFHHAAEGLVGHALPRGELAFRVPPGAEDALAGLPSTSPLVVLCPGAAWATKRWPAERFAAVAQRAVAAGLVVAVTGSEAERGQTAPVAAVDGVHDLTGLPLDHLGALLQRAAVVVTHDSGPLHLARALRVPAVAVFGPTDPAQFDLEPHVLVRHEVPCAPCHFHGQAACPRRHFACMRDLPVEDVWRALGTALAGPKPRAVSG